MTRYVLPALLPAGFAIPMSLPSARASPGCSALAADRGVHIMLCDSALAALALALLFLIQRHRGPATRCLESRFVAMSSAMTPNCAPIWGQPTCAIWWSFPGLTWYRYARRRAGRSRAPAIGGRISDRRLRLPGGLPAQHGAAGMPPQQPAGRGRTSGRRNRPLRAGRCVATGWSPLEDVEATRHAALVTARDLEGTSLNAGFEALVLG